MKKLEIQVIVFMRMFARSLWRIFNLMAMYICMYNIVFKFLHICVIFIDLEVDGLFRKSSRKSRQEELNDKLFDKKNLTCVDEILTEYNAYEVSFQFMFLSMA